MTDTKGVSEHYTSGGLLDRIKAGLAALGASEPLDIETLAAADEFHIGGRRATVPFMKQLNMTHESRVLDLGCGLGGPARFAAKTTGAQVTGIDLTAEFVEAGRVLTKMARLADQVDLIEGSILELPFADNSFDTAYMIHVGMNIADKDGLAREAARVLKPGGVFAIYDVMQVGDDDLIFPVPWASDPSGSALAKPSAYREALKGAGFALESEQDRTGFAKEFFAALAASQTAAAGPPPLGLHLVMGPETKTMVANMVQNIADGRIAPIEMIARLPD
jgi:ubiquinone/menaquinone biosynthesis C-methylase UbiE